MKKIFAASVIMGILSVLLSFCARKVTGFAQTYSVTVYPVLKGIFARISGIFPFSVSEAGLYFLLCFILFCLIRWFKKPLFLLNGACFIAALLFSCLQSTAALTITEILFPMKLVLWSGLIL